MMGSAMMAQNKQIAFQNISLDQAFKQGREKHKIIFVVCHNKVVNASKEMERQVFIHDGVADKFNSTFVNLKLDHDLGDGKKVVQKYRVKNFPTMLFLDPSGNVVFQKSGYLKPMEMLKLAEDAASPENIQRIAKAEYLKAKTDPNVVYRYLWFLRQRSLPEDKVLDDYWMAVPDAALIKKIHWAMIKDFADNLTSKAARRFVQKRDAFITIVEKDSVHWKVADLHYLEALRMSNTGATFTAMDAFRKEAFNLKMGDGGVTVAFVDLVIADKRQNWAALADAVDILYVKRKPQNKYQEEEFTRMLNYYINYFIPKNEQGKAIEWAFAIKDVSTSPAQLMGAANLLLELKDIPKAIIVAEKAVVEKKRLKESPFLVQRFLEDNGVVFDKKIEGYHTQNDSIFWTFDPASFTFAIHNDNGNMIYIKNQKVESVSLAGEFNNWSRTETPLAQDSLGNWALKQHLEPYKSQKRWEFKFVVNGVYWIAPTIHTLNRQLAKGKDDEVNFTNFLLLLDGQDR